VKKGMIRLQPQLEDSAERPVMCAVELALAEPNRSAEAVDFVLRLVHWVQTRRPAPLGESAVVAVVVAIAAVAAVAGTVTVTATAIVIVAATVLATVTATVPATMTVTVAVGGNAKGV